MKVSLVTKRWLGSTKCGLAFRCCDVVSCIQPAVHVHGELQLCDKHKAMRDADEKAKKAEALVQSVRKAEGAVLVQGQAPDDSLR